MSNTYTFTHHPDGTERGNHPPAEPEIVTSGFLTEITRVVCGTCGAPTTSNYLEPGGCLYCVT